MGHLRGPPRCSAVPKEPVAWVVPWAERHRDGRRHHICDTRPDPQVDHPIADRPTNRRAVVTAGILSPSGGSPPGTLRPPRRPLRSAPLDGCACPAAPSSRRRRPPLPPSPRAHPWCSGREEARRLPEHSSGAQRASSRRIRSLLTAVLAALFLATATTATAPEAQAATRKVVIVVGPVGGATASYKSGANKLADQARSYGASVTKVYTPNATWSRVYEAAKGANLLIYLGHGNGWPSTHAPFDVKSKDGMGLNRTPAAATPTPSTSASTTWRSWPWRRTPSWSSTACATRPATTSGGRGTPRSRPRSSGSTTTATASSARGRRRSTPAGSPTSATSCAACSGLGGTTLSKVFWTDPNRTGTYKFAFTSVRTPGATALMDPYARGRYYRSVIGSLGTTVGDWRAGGLRHAAVDAGELLVVAPPLVRVGLGQLARARRPAPGRSAGGSRTASRRPRSP